MTQFYFRYNVLHVLRFLPLKNNSVIVGLNFLSASMSAIMSSNAVNNLFSSLDYSLLNFHIHHQLFVNNQWMILDFSIL